MNLYKKNNKIYVDYILGAKRIRKSLKLEWNKTNLNYVKAEIMPKLLRQTSVVKDYLLSELLQMFLDSNKMYVKESSSFSYKTCAKTILNTLEDKDIKKYSIKDIENFAIMLYKKGMSSGFIKNILSLLKRTFDLGIKLEAITFNPVFKIKVPERKVIKREAYTKEKIKLLLDNANGELKTFLYIAVYTGARPGEILALEYQDLQGNYITINKTLAINIKAIQTPKTGKNRTIYIPKKLVNYLNRLPIRGKFFTKTYYDINRKFKKLCKELDITYSGLHSLRHTYASFLLNDKVNPIVIKEVLGHTDLSMLNKIYGHFLGYKEDDKNHIQNSLNF